MSKRESYEQKTEELLAPLMEQHQFELLDVHDYIEDTYILEVSSPGLGRPLRKDKDFARSIGEEVEVRTFRAIAHQKEFTGILKDYDKEKIVIELENEESMEFQRADIALIRLAFDF